MKKLFLLLLLCVSVGAGCSNEPRESENRRIAWSDVRGIDLILSAESQDGSPVVLYRPSIGRRFRSKIGSTFTDFNGSYRMSDGSSVDVQLGVQGTPEQDREQFKQISSLTSFEDGELGSWMMTIAYDTSASRWVLRAAQKDVGFAEDAYHVIECISVETSDYVFWDGCKTVIENTQIIADSQ